MLTGLRGVGLHSRKHDHEVEFYAFDILVSDGEDLRRLPLSMRKDQPRAAAGWCVDGIFLSDFEQGEIGPYSVPARLLAGAGGLVLEASRERLSRAAGSGTGSR